MSLLARRGSLHPPPAAAEPAEPPQFVAATTGGAFTGSDQPVAAAAPVGLAAGDLQLAAVYCVSSSPTFPGTPPAGWTQILDEAFTFPDEAATSTGRLGLFTSTSALGAFEVTMSQNRVWNTVRGAWRGAQLGGSPAFSFTPSGAGHPAPALDAPANSAVVAIAASELANGGDGWGWTGVTGAAMRGNRTARNPIEAAALALADTAVVAPTAGVSAGFALASAQRAAMVSLVLHGLPA